MNMTKSFVSQLITTDVFIQRCSRLKSLPPIISIELSKKKKKIQAYKKKIIKKETYDQ